MVTTTTAVAIWRVSSMLSTGGALVGNLECRQGAEHQRATASLHGWYATKMSQIPDGTSNTLIIGEVTGDEMAPTRAGLGHTAT